MYYFEKIKNLINDNKWDEVEYIFSTIKTFKEDRDGNPDYIYFFQNNLSQAIILSEKYNLIPQLEIMFSLSYSSSDFRKQFAYNLLESKTLNPEKLFKNIISGEQSFSELIIVNQDIFKLIVDFYQQNNVKNILDSETLETIFLNEDNRNTLHNTKKLFEFILYLSDINNYLLFNSCVQRKNYHFLELIVTHWKKEKEQINSTVFLQSIHEGFLNLEKNLKHPFIKAEEKNKLNLIIEDIHKIQLLFSFKDKPSNINKKNRHKI